MWDFRDSNELNIETEFMSKGYIISDGDIYYLDLMKQRLGAAFLEFADQQNSQSTKLENAHNIINKEDSNKLRLFALYEALTSFVISTSSMPVISFAEIK